jgi:hypothetical protein
MNKHWRIQMALWAGLFGNLSYAQVGDDGFGNYRLDPINPATGPRSFSIGPVFNGGAPAAFLNIRGDQVQPINYTASVFRTIGSPGLDAYWNFFSGGPNAVNERAQLFSINGENHFNLNTPNGDFRLLTNTIERARLYGTQTSNFNVNYPAVAQGGFLALSGQPNFFDPANSPGPFSRLHLVDQAGNGATPIFYAPTAAYRGWMRNGVTFSGNADMGYIGQRYNGNDRTDMVIHWSNDAGTMAFAPDRLRFMFTTGQDGAVSGATSVAGLEAARFYPVRTFEVFMGLGDFFAGNLVDPVNITEPTERFDVLNGRVRLRDLPDPAGEADGPYQVMVVDNSAFPNAERGVVKWVNPNDLPQASADCDWVVQPIAPHVSAVYDPSSCSWDRRHGVGVGVQYPKFKLHVEHTNDEILNPTAVYGDARFDFNESEEVIGVHGLARTSSETGAILGMQAIGVLGIGLTSKFSTGVVGIASTMTSSSGTASTLIGVDGVSGATENASLCIGVRGFAEGAIDANNWAIWSEGYQYSSTGPSWTPSDENLKTDIEDLTGSMDRLSQLQPKSYRFRAEELGFMHLAEEPQFGFLAQDLEAVFPDLVREIHRPVEIDSTGAEISPAIDFKAVNYNGLIPLLVAAVKEQQQTIEGQASRLDQMEQLLAECCNRPSTDGLRENTPGIPSLNDTEGDGKLRIQPNPFSESTTVYYTLERGGRAQLMANSADGKQLRVLQEATLEGGDYQYNWNTADLAAGIYYVTLLVDGQPVVKKAVKVNR